MVGDDQEFMQQSPLALCHLLTKAYQMIDSQSDEILHILSLLATLALGCQYPCGIYHLKPQERRSPDWSSLVVIDLPAGQICWAIPQKKWAYFQGLPTYRGTWKGYPDRASQHRLFLQPRCGFQNYPTERFPSTRWPPRS